MVLTLYKLDASSAARTVLMTIEALKIPDVVYVDVNLLEGEHLKEEYLKLNPQHTIPMLKDDDFVIWDSHAIVTYLVGTYAEDDTLYPKDLKKRAIVDQRLHLDSGMLFPILREANKPVIFDGAKSFKADALKKIESAYELTNKLLTSRWLAGDDMTLADICCITTISSMELLLPIDKDKFKNLWVWTQRCAHQHIYKTKNEPGLQQLRALIRSKLT